MTHLRRIDVVVCTAVVVVLLTALVPAIERARETARRTQSKHNLKQLGIACFNYHEHFGCLPAGGTFGSDGIGYHGWMTQLLWYIDQNNIGTSIDWSLPWNSSRNAGHLLLPLACFQIPGEACTVKPTEFAPAHYSANPHLLAVNSVVSFDQVDSIASRFLAAELRGDFVPWASPYNFRALTAVNGDPATYGHYSGRGCQFLYLDGHVDLIANEAFPVQRASLSGPDLANFDVVAASFVLPLEFRAPKDALTTTSIRLQSSNQFIVAQRDIQGNVVCIQSTDSNPKHGKSVSIQDSDLAAFVRYRELQDLRLDGEFTNAGLSHLRALTKLTTLHLKSDQITEEGLSVLGPLPQLEELRVEGAKITDAVRERLKNRWPGCVVRSGISLTE